MSPGLRDIPTFVSRMWRGLFTVWWIWTRYVNIEPLTGGLLGANLPILETDDWSAIDWMIATLPLPRLWIEFHQSPLCPYWKADSGNYIPREKEGEREREEQGWDNPSNLTWSYVGLQTKPKNVVREIGEERHGVASFNSSILALKIQQFKRKYSIVKQPSCNSLKTSLIF